MRFWPHRILSPHFVLHASGGAPGNFLGTRSRAARRARVALAAFSRCSCCALAQLWRRAHFLLLVLLMLYGALGIWDARSRCFAARSGCSRCVLVLLSLRAGALAHINFALLMLYRFSRCAGAASCARAALAVRFVRADESSVKLRASATRPAVPAYITL